MTGVFPVRFKRRKGRLLPKVQSYLSRLTDLKWASNPSVRKWALLLAAMFVAIGLVISLHQAPLELDVLRWQPLLLLCLILVPLTLVFNALEYMLSGAFVGTKIPIKKAFEITIIGSAANLLPLPGSTLVRVAGLKAAGVGYGPGTSATLFIAFVWLGVACLYAGAWMSFIGVGGTALTFVVIGLAGIGLSFVWSKTLKLSLTLTMAAMAMKLLLVVLGGLRMWLSFEALGSDATFAQASSLVIAGFVGAAVTVVPAGLGISEGAAAFLGPVVGLSAGVCFIATFLNRISDMTIIALLALFLATARRRESA